MVRADFNRRASTPHPMLDAIRTASSKWLGRLVLTVIMGFLIVSFAIWGIGDMFRGSVSRTVATVGSETIGSEEFRNNFNRELQRVQQQTRRPVTTEQARAFGLDRTLLNQMIDEAALSQRAKALGLAVDDATVLRTITEAPDFKTAGVFDRQRLGDAIRQAGMTEQEFFRKQGELVTRLQLYGGLVGGMPGSTSLSRAIHQYREEQRNFDVVVVPADKVPAPAEPSEADLKAFFDERKAEFRTVETRKVTVIKTSPADFAGELTVTDADLKAYYDRELAAGRFGSPEKRQAQRVLFDTEADANAAAEKLAGGMTFEALLAEKKLAEKDVDLGLKTANEIADPAVRAAIFATDVGKVSAPVKDPFGFVLLRVTKIEPAQVQAFETVKDRIAAAAREDKLRRDPTISGKLATIYRAIEDQRIAGKSLAEAAKAAGVTETVIPALDRQGSNGAGGRVDVPGGTETVNSIFASDIGLDNEPLQQRDTGYIWYEVNGVEPARDKTFEEVKDDVKARFLADRRDKALAEFVTTQIQKIESGTSFAIVASQLLLPIQRVTAVKRNGQDSTLGQAGVERGFSGPIGKAVSAVAPNGGRLIIMPIETSLLPYDPAVDEKSGFLKQIGTGIGTDIMAQYTAAIRKDLGVSINQSQVDQALGQSATR
jgi:peptidyl-prolyl cis-trans isomerase D